VKRRGLWAARLDSEFGGQGFGQLKPGLLHEILGCSPFAPNPFGCQAPDSGNSEIRAIAGTPEQKKRWPAPLLAGAMARRTGQHPAQRAAGTSFVNTARRLQQNGEEI